jgi:hypothetical protein
MYTKLTRRRRNQTWEREYRLKELKTGANTLLCTNPVDKKNIMPTLSDSTGAYAKWMSTLNDIR